MDRSAGPLARANRTNPNFPRILVRRMRGWRALRRRAGGIRSLSPKTEEVFVLAQITAEAPARAAASDFGDTFTPGEQRERSSFRSADGVANVQT